MKTGFGPQDLIGGFADRSGPGTGTSSDTRRFVRRLGLALLAVHLGLVLWLAFRPVSAAWMADTNLTPFATVRSELAVGTPHAYLELLRGLLILAPLGVLLPLAGARTRVAVLPSFLRTVFAGVLIATAVEVLQSTLSSHLLDVDDVILAAIGIGAVHLSVVPAARAALRRRYDSGSDPETDPETGGPGHPGRTGVRLARGADVGRRATGQAGEYGATSPAPVNGRTS